MNRSGKYFGIDITLTDRGAVKGDSIKQAIIKAMAFRLRTVRDRIALIDMLPEEMRNASTHLNLEGVPNTIAVELLNFYQTHGDNNKPGIFVLLEKLEERDKLQSELQSPIELGGKLALQLAKYDTKELIALAETLGMASAPLRIGPDQEAKVIAVLSFAETHNKIEALIAAVEERNQGKAK